MILKMCIASGFTGLFHWPEPRILGIGEIKRLASFPDQFEFVGSFRERWARIGNCVPPLLMRAIANSLNHRERECHAALAG
jgi:DNA (cytosine-5)-methyltransferase 1